MSTYRRNVFVGITVLVSLVILAWMIIQFGARIGSAFAGEQIVVTFRAQRADGINPGSAVRHLGTEVGRIESVALNAAEQVIVIQANIEKDKLLPANLIGEVRIPSFLGSGAIMELVLNGDKPQGLLAKNAEIPVKYVGLGVLPPEITELANELKFATKEFRQANLIADFKKAVTNLDQQITTAGQVLADLRKVTGDEAVQQDLRTTIANARKASEEATAALGNFKKFGEDLQSISDRAKTAIDKFSTVADNANDTVKTTQERIVKLSDEFNGRLRQLATALDNVNSITTKLDQGNGTMGQLLNDGKLYVNLLESTKLLNSTINDVQRVVQQIEQEGLTFRLR
jgi:phospholipid/cholesterol/gamma-HCH transport system substrate-binding protein